MRILKIFKNLKRLPEVFNCMLTTPQWRQIILAYLGFRSLQYPFVFKTRKGSQLLINTFHDLVTIWVIFFRHEYRVPTEAEIIVDAGANIGTFSIYACEQAPHSKILALEPFPETLKQLKSNITLNGLEDRITIVEKALAGQTGSLLMDDADVPSQSRGMKQDGAQGGLSVPVLSLSDFIKDHDLTRIDLFKMDIEGSEYEVLFGAENLDLDPIHVFSLEYHPNGQRSELFQLLQGSGFQLKYDLRVSENSGVAWFDRKNEISKAS